VRAVCLLQPSFQVAKCPSTGPLDASSWLISVSDKDVAPRTPMAAHSRLISQDLQWANSYKTVLDRQYVHFCLSYGLENLWFVVLPSSSLLRILDWLGPPIDWSIRWLPWPSLDLDLVFLAAFPSGLDFKILGSRFEVIGVAVILAQSY